MIVKDKKNQEVEITVYGKYEDDIQIDSAFYVDESLGEVSNETVDYIQSRYEARIYEQWLENKRG